MTIDSHQHFWKYNQVRDAWIDESMKVIRRDFLPEDLRPILKDNAIDGCIAVQADQSETETEFLLNLAKNNPEIKGVVGWVDLRAANVEERLAYYSKNPIFKGVRHIVQAESETFVLQEDFQKGIGKLAKFGLTYDILVTPNQLENVCKLIDKFPNQKFVLDHLGKPYIKNGKIENWEENIRKLTKFTNVSCKLSGFVTEADWGNWKVDNFKVYFDVIFEAFGVDRILFGSDWPVCQLAAEYKEVVQIVDNYIGKFSTIQQNKIMGENAVEFYNL